VETSCSCRERAMQQPTASQRSVYLPSCHCRRREPERQGGRRIRRHAWRLCGAAAVVYKSERQASVDQAACWFCPSTQMAKCYYYTIPSVRKTLDILLLKKVFFILKNLHFFILGVHFFYVAAPCNPL